MEKPAKSDCFACRKSLLLLRRFVDAALWLHCRQHGGLSRQLRFISRCGKVSPERGASRKFPLFPYKISVRKRVIRASLKSSGEFQNAAREQRHSPFTAPIRAVVVSAPPTHVCRGATRSLDNDSTEKSICRFREIPPY